jgi:hypothetical protein
LWRRCFDGGVVSLLLTRRRHVDFLRVAAGICPNGR